MNRYLVHVTVDRADVPIAAVAAALAHSTAAEALGEALDARVSLSLRPVSPTFPHAVPYLLAIDGPLLREQRQALGALLARSKWMAERELLTGIQELLDAIADQAHDRYGIDCLSC